ncbi:hypothetical protein PR048_031944 [Dryococelus australis]|uniref:Uncharacterized protein n=1 Tax=Dryococelus australis TaxID=614101 RepID=A0ABQ9G6Q1_9NEOP|nr:hypothetical protein PR048_031944 [Dryococelus australis]
MDHEKKPSCYNDENINISDFLFMKVTIEERYKVVRCHLKYFKDVPTATIDQFQGCPTATIDQFQGCTDSNYRSVSRIFKDVQTATIDQFQGCTDSNYRSVSRIIFQWLNTHFRTLDPTYRKPYYNSMINHAYRQFEKLNNHLDVNCKFYTEDGRILDCIPIMTRKDKLFDARK